MTEPIEITASCSCFSDFGGRFIFNLKYISKGSYRLRKTLTRLGPSICPSVRLSILSFLPNEAAHLNDLTRFRKKVKTMSGRIPSTSTSNSSSSSASFTSQMTHPNQTSINAGHPVQIIDITSDHKFKLNEENLLPILSNPRTRSKKVDPRKAEWPILLWSVL